MAYKNSYRARVGNGILLLLLGILFVLWVAFTPVLQEGESAKQLFSESCSSMAMLLMAFSLVLATKVRGIESFFGGLDKMYMAHKRNGILALLLLVAHFFTVVEKPAVEGHPDNFNPGGPLGMLAFVGLLVMVLMAVAPRIPFIGGYIKLSYSKWQVSHKAIGIFFIIGAVHAILLDTMMERSTALKTFNGLVILTGGLAYFYKLVLFRFVRRKYPYVVLEANHLNPSVVEVVLEPKKKPLSYNAGQFLFVEFEGDKLLSESHPFTISSAPTNENIRLTIRASGDYTRHVYKTLKRGTPAKLEGSYGRFDHSQASRQQVWVGGGIGLTPFLSWARQFQNDNGFDVDLFYTVSSKEDAIFLDELNSVARENDNFRLHVVYSNIDGRLDADKIISKVESFSNRDFFFCGPAAMTESIANQLKSKGIPDGNIHFEEFSFR